MHTGTVHFALGRIARRPNVSCPRAALARVLCCCPPARAQKPRARSESTRASSQRVHRVGRAEHRSDGRRSRGAWNVRAKASAPVEHVRHGCGSGRRFELGSACVAMVVARGTCAKASHLTSVVRMLRAPSAEAESALSAHESVRVLKSKKEPFFMRRVRDASGTRPPLIK
jgi:hypothetical protein